jgi:probable rRNA maturation factor
MTPAQATVRAKREGFSLSIVASAGVKHIAYLRKQLLAAWPLVRRAPRELSVALVNDKRMSDLHEQFLKVTGPTDVLTFELEHDARGQCTSGEVVVCVPEAERQAAERGIEVQDEVLLYALHGLLHLSGYDDKTDAAYRAMHRREDEILQQLGVGKTFARRPLGPRRSQRKPAATSRGRTRS